MNARRGYGGAGARRTWLAALALVLAAALLAGCQLTNAKSDRVEVAWSRGLRLGQAATNDRPGLGLDDATGASYVAWAGRAPGAAAPSAGRPAQRQALHLARLDRAGRVTAQRVLDIAAERPSDLALLVTSPDQVQVFWLDSLDGAVQLFHAVVDSAGQVRLAPQRLALPGDGLAIGGAVDSYAVGANPSGTVDVFIATREGRQAGLYHARLDRAGQSVAAPQRLRPSGYAPAVAYGREGLAHLVWLDVPDYGERVLYYATLGHDPGQLAHLTLMQRFPVPIGLVAHRPAVGLTGDTVHVFWSVERRGGGLTPPSAWAAFVSFPRGQPEAASAAMPVLVGATAHPALQAAPSLFPVAQLAPAVQERGVSDFVYQPAAAPTNEDDLAVAYAAQLQGRTKSTIQIALTVWRDGALVGYQIAAKTSAISLQPVLVADAQRDLHLAWIDTAGFGVYDVYYASTADAVEAQLNRVTAEDALSALLAVAWSIAQSLSFLPLALIWMFLPLVAMVVYVLIEPEGRLDRTGPRVMLIVSMVLYVVGKYLFRPSWLAALPLPAGISQGAANLILYAAPLVISGLAALLLVLYVRRHETPSMFAAFLVFALGDALLTVLLYVPGILAE